MKSNSLQIIIKIPDNFLAERKYVLDIILGELLDLPYLIIPDTKLSYYQFNLPNNNIVIIEDHFFNHFKEPQEYLNQKNIPQQVLFTKNRFSPEKDVAILFGSGELRIENIKNNKRLTCSIDIFAGAFFMLTRWEEYVVKSRDEHNRFTAQFSLANKYHFLHRPVINEYTEMLWNILVYLEYKGKRKNRQYRLELTHDVDQLLYIKNLKNMLKRTTGDIFKRRDIKLAVQTMKIFLSARLGIKKDPYDSFDYLMDVAESKNIKSIFNFLAGKTTIYDHDLFIEEKRTERLIKRITKRGHLVGFHPSYNTYNNDILWQEEYQRICSVSDQPINSGRQHYLRFAIPYTWQIWNDHHMEFDSSLTYSDKAGFRCGICDAYSVFNILTRKKMALKEKPLVAMDATFVDYQKDSPQVVKKQILNLMKVVKKYKGVFVFLWHNSSFCLPPWDHYQHIYPEVVLNR